MGVFAMSTLRRYEVGETKCLDDGSDNKALQMGCGKSTIIYLVFDKEKVSHVQVHELDRLLGKMGLTAVEVLTEEPRRVIQAVRSRRRLRPGQVI